MTKFPRRWFLISLAHPLLSALGIVLGSTISGWLGYAAPLLTFLVNLPGIFLIHQFTQPVPADPASTMDPFVVVSMIALTWLFVVAPACFLVSRFLSNRAGR